MEQSLLELIRKIGTEENPSTESLIELSRQLFRHGFSPYEPSSYQDTCGLVDVIYKWMEKKSEEFMGKVRELLGPTLYTGPDSHPACRIIECSVRWSREYWKNRQNVRGYGPKITGPGKGSSVPDGHPCLVVIFKSTYGYGKYWDNEIGWFLSDEDLTVITDEQLEDLVADVVGHLGCYGKWKGWMKKSKEK